ncbi:MAG: hypothetical protein WC770_04505 [Phycisphaerae bacterium]|jgi:hypothetical protein
MKEKWLVVFGPPAPEYNISIDLRWNDRFATEKREYAHAHLKAHMLSAGIKYCYIVKDWISQDSRIVTKSNANKFWVEFLKQGKDNPALGSKHILEIRRMREIDGDFYCTDPYRLYYQDICSKWPKKRIKALEP